jgi:hypothetical protein
MIIAKEKLKQRKGDVRYKLISYSVISEYEHEEK